ncbi:hypothetical protein niasHS_010971 [Heterodera schachtii]|uniref:Uncharacterized protein n=1 Tax=Heterodera schachtii TaxID=97005 RepID=A0ABD2IT44_HETSC
MWAYHSQNRPSSWAHYYGHSAAEEQRRAATNSGIAAGLTLILFLVVFLISLGCRHYNNKRHNQQNSLPFVCPSSPVGPSVDPSPPPSYENALRLPAFPLASSAPPPSINAPFRVPKTPKERREQRS